MHSSVPRRPRSRVPPPKRRRRHLRGRRPDRLPLPVQCRRHFVSVGSSSTRPVRSLALARDDTDRSRDEEARRAHRSACRPQAPVFLASVGLNTWRASAGSSSAARRCLGRARSSAGRTPGTLPRGNATSCLPCRSVRLDSSGRGAPGEALHTGSLERQESPAALQVVVSGLGVRRERAADRPNRRSFGIV